MTPLRILATAVLPSMLVGGLLFHTASGQPAPPAPPAPPAVPAVPPSPPAPPAPPAPPLQIDGVREMVRQQLEAARQQLDNPNLPPKVRAKLRARLDRLEGKLDRRLSHLDISDMSKMQEQLEQMGEDISSSMEGFGEEMDAWGKAFGEQVSRQVEQQVEQQVQQQMQQQMQQTHVHVQMSGSDTTFHWDGNGNGDEGEDHDVDSDGDGASNAAEQQQEQEVAVAASHLGDLGLQQEQRERIAKIRAEAEQHVAQARGELTRMSHELRAHLADANVDRDEVAREIDAIAAKEAELRKARILGWVDARRVLDDSQRKRVEDAARNKPR